jgi:hypothetical protein
VRHMLSNKIYRGIKQGASSTQMKRKDNRRRTIFPRSRYRRGRSLDACAATPRYVRPEAAIPNERRMAICSAAWCIATPATVRSTATGRRVSVATIAVVRVREERPKCVSAGVRARLGLGCARCPHRASAARPPHRSDRCAPRAYLDTDVSKARPASASLNEDF